jgi:MFS family permease
MVPQVVPRELYPASAAWTSSVYQFSAIIGPALGGLVYGEIGSSYAFGMIPAFIFLSLICVALLSTRAKEIRNNRNREPFGESIRAGVKFVLRQKALLSSMTLDMFSVFFGGAVAVLPIYADQVLHVGASGLGILRSAPGIGSLLVLLVMAIRPLKVISGQTLLIVVAGFGLCIVGFGFSTNYALSLTLLGFSGAFDAVSVVIRQTILQLLTPDQYRGRVSSVSTVFITSSNEIGAFESGFAASIMGLVPSVVFGGAMTLLIVAGTAIWFPELRRTRIAH